MKISALDESGNPVDWWFIYKVPQLGKGAGCDEATGYEYVYYDSTLDSAILTPDPKKRTVTKSDYKLNRRQRCAQPYARFCIRPF